MPKDIIPPLPLDHPLYDGRLLTLRRSLVVRSRLYWENGGEADEDSREEDQKSSHQTSDKGAD